MKDGRVILNLSGASTKIAGLAGAADYTFNVLGYRPTDITGISSGALLAIPIAMRKWDILREMTQTFTLDDIFDIKPINKDNKITVRAKIRALIGKVSFGTQNNLYDTIEKVVTREEFSRYQDGDYPNVWMGSVDFKTGSRCIMNVKDKKVDYDEFLLLVNASSSIPLAVEPVHYKDMILFDGGVRNHILSAWALRNIEHITQTISIFSRPDNFTNILNEAWYDKNMISVFERYTDIETLEVSKRDEKEESLLLEVFNNRRPKNKIKNAQIFIPSIIKEMYDTDPAKLRKLYNAGFKAAASELNKWG